VINSQNFSNQWRAVPTVVAHLLIRLLENWIYTVFIGERSVCDVNNSTRRSGAAIPSGIEFAIALASRDETNNPRTFQSPSLNLPYP